MIILTLYFVLVLCCLWLALWIVGKLLGMPIKGIKSFVEWIIELVRG